VFTIYITSCHKNCKACLVFVAYHSIVLCFIPGRFLKIPPAVCANLVKNHRKRLTSFKYLFAGVSYKEIVKKKNIQCDFWILFYFLFIYFF